MVSVLVTPPGHSSLSDVWILFFINMTVVILVLSGFIWDKNDEVHIKRWLMKTRSGRTVDSNFMSEHLPRLIRASLLGLCHNFEPHPTHYFYKHANFYSLLYEVTLLFCLVLRTRQRPFWMTSEKRKQRCQPNKFKTADFKKMSDT